jgi:UDP-glucose 4-epimerase
MEKQKFYNRVVILGSRSFVGKAIANKLYDNNIEPLLISRKEIDLESKISTFKLNKIIKNNDVVVIVAAKSPVKNIETLNQNLIMAKNIIESLKKVKLSHLIYVSSDAVYSDTKKKINEQSETIPLTLHGFMHLIRETMFKELNCLKTFVRPTLIYGVSDPHNSYGTNKFTRCAQSNKKIILFGKGEEKRDHVHVDNVAEIVATSIINKIGGIVNAVSGSVISFFEIAKILKKNYPTLQIKTTKRTMPMPHKGYRGFDIALLRKKFPNIKLVKLPIWLAKKYKYKQI